MWRLCGVIQTIFGDLSVWRLWRDHHAGKLGLVGCVGPALRFQCDACQWAYIRAGQAGQIGSGIDLKAGFGRFDLHSQTIGAGENRDPLRALCWGIAEAEVVVDVGGQGARGAEIKTGVCD